MTDSFQTDLRLSLRRPIQFGLLAGVVALSVSMMGMVELFGKRSLIAGILTLGQLLLYATAAAMGYLVARDAPKEKRGISILYGLICGLLAAIPLIVLVALANAFDLRQIFLNVSPALIETLTFGQGAFVGSHTDARHDAKKQETTNNRTLAEGQRFYEGR